MRWHCGAAHRWKGAAGGSLFRVDLQRQMKSDVPTPRETLHPQHLQAQEFMYVCMYVCIHVYMYVYIGQCVCIHVCMYVFVHACKYVCIRVHECMYLSMYT